MNITYIYEDIIRSHFFRNQLKISRKKLIWTSITIIFNIFILISLNYNEYSDKEFSYIFIFDYLLIFLAIWNTTGKKISPFILFYLTFGLFIGGRFFAVALSPYYDYLWQPTLFMKNYYIPNSLTNETILQILTFILFLSIGYICIKKRKNILNKKKSFFDFNKKELIILNKIIRYVFPFFLISILLVDILAIRSALTGGYLALYEGQSSNEGGIITSLLSSFYSISFGIALAIGNSSNKKKYIILFVLDALLIMFIGSRGGFGASALLLLWIYSQSHKISLKRLALYGFGSLMLLFLIFSFSIRGEANGFSLDNFNFILASFIYGQGVSMVVFNTIKFIPSFPTISYLTALFPFVVPIYVIITGSRPAPYEYSFSNYFASYINPELYFSGQGMGWTILGDIYLFSFGSLILFIILSFLVGLSFGWVENKSSYNNFWRIFLYAFITNIVILPRGTIMRILPKIIPFGLYIIILILLVRLFLQLRDKGYFKFNLKQN